MITTILIVLVAVVVLIVIIAVLALRYLRADDSDSFDDIPDEPRRARRPAEPEREREPVAVGGQNRRPRPAPAEPVTEAWAADRPSRPSDGRGQRGYREPGSGPRSAATERGASQPGAARRQPAPARADRPGRRADAAARPSNWDSLSDVDYWAELAADKPQITPAQSGPVAAGRRGGDPGPGPDGRQPAAARPAGRADQGQGPVTSRKRALPPRTAGAVQARAADPGQTEQIDARAAQAAPLSAPAPAPAGQRAAPPRPATGPRPALPSRPPASGGQAPYPNGTGRSGSRADDDPLTSPSFPAVNTSDSRSYRGRRPGSGAPGSSGQHARPVNPNHQYIEYSSGPDRNSRPNGYPVQPTAQQPAAQLQADASPPARPARPAAAATSGAVHGAANPYGSYVSVPEPAPPEPAPGYQQAGYQPTAYDQASRTGPAGHGSGAHSRAENGFAARTYPAIDYSSLTYDDPVYPDDRSALTGYGSHRKPIASYDQQDYRSPDAAGYGQDRYQGYPGYGTGGR